MPYPRAARKVLTRFAADSVSEMAIGPRILRLKPSARGTRAVRLRPPAGVRVSRSEPRGRLPRSAGLAAHDRGATAPGPVCRPETLPGRPAGRRGQRAQTPHLSLHGLQGEIDVRLDAETSETEAQ